MRWSPMAEHCHVSAIVFDDQPITPISEGVRAYASDPDHAEALWAKSEILLASVSTEELVPVDHQNLARAVFCGCARFMHQR